jgi:hypothetical protein
MRMSRLYRIQAITRPRSVARLTSDTRCRLQFRFVSGHIIHNTVGSSLPQALRHSDGLLRVEIHLGHQRSCQGGSNSGAGHDALDEARFLSDQIPEFV